MLAPDVQFMNRFMNLCLTEKLRLISLRNFGKRKFLQTIGRRRGQAARRLMLVLIAQLRRAVRQSRRCLPSPPGTHTGQAANRASPCAPIPGAGVSPSARSAAHRARRVSRQSMRAFCDIAGEGRLGASGTRLFVPDQDCPLHGIEAVFGTDHRAPHQRHRGGRRAARAASVGVGRFGA